MDVEANMRKVQFTATFWTLLLAIPFTALALSLAAFITENLSMMMSWLLQASQATTVGARGWLMEFSERWPEVAGMVIGQLVIMAILLFTKRSQPAENHTSTR